MSPRRARLTRSLGFIQAEHGLLFNLLELQACHSVRQSRLDSIFCTWHSYFISVARTLKIRMAESNGPNSATFSLLNSASLFKTRRLQAKHTLLRTSSKACFSFFPCTSLLAALLASPFFGCSSRVSTFLRGSASAQPAVHTPSRGCA